MSVEGHWTVRFASVAGDKVQRESGGVVTFRAGQIVGGDTWAYYSGSYELSGRRMTLRVDVAIHYTEGGESVLGGPLVPYTLMGFADLSEDGRQLEASLHIEGNENAVLIALLSKVVDIRS
jgi:hypothetical protein